MKLYVIGKQLEIIFNFLTYKRESYNVRLLSATIKLYATSSSLIRKNK